MGASTTPLLRGYPRGWFVVGFSQEFLADKPARLSYFGGELVAFRGASGDVRVFDAHCPHLGAHLAEGGRIEDGTLVCPFHAWRFDGQGRCIEIPYAKRIPPKACLRAWPCRELNGLVFVWYDPQGEAPSWEIPEIDVWGDPAWSDWTWSSLQVATHPREIVENVVDIAHFRPVHQTSPASFQNVFEGHLAIQRSEGTGTMDNDHGEAAYRIEATYYGPGYQISAMESLGLETRLLNAHTMIREDLLELRFGVLFKHPGDPKHTQRFTRAYVRDLTRGFQQDIAIWEHKAYRERPLLCDGDGSIPDLRRWYAQFFS